MIETVIKIVITAFISGALGYLTSHVRGLKAQKEAIKCLLRANMVNQYFAYKEMGKMPYYCKQSWYAMYEAYSQIGGNSFVEEIKEKVELLDTIQD